MNRRAYIDFDLAGIEGKKSYNHHGIKEQHQDGRCDQYRKKEHDRFALHTVLTDSTFYSKLLPHRTELLAQLLRLAI